MGHKDILWKGLLEWVFEDFLRFVFADAEKVFDLEKGFDFMDKELAEIDPEAGKNAGVRYVDKLVKVYRKNGGEEWMLVHVEVQDKTRAKDRPFFPERMFRYFYRCFDRYQKPIAAIAILCGPDGKQLYDRFNYEFMGTRLQYSYNTLCILDYSDEQLGRSSNPFSWVVLAAKQALLKGKKLDDKLLEGKLFIFRKLWEDGLLEKRKLQAVFRFLERYVQFEKKETIRKFRREIDEITHKKNAMDIFEQIAEMDREEVRKEERKKLSRDFVRRLLARNGMTLQEIASLAGVSLAEVKRVKTRIKAK